MDTILNGKSAAGGRGNASAHEIATPRLVCLAGHHIGRTFAVNTETISLGRVSANDVCIRNPHVSRRHAQIFKQGSDCRLVDLKSRNNTFVNGVAVHEHWLEHGDEIVIADHRYVYLSNAEDEIRGTADASPDVRSDLERGRTITLRSAIARDVAYAKNADEVDSERPEERVERKHLAVLLQIAKTVTADANRRVLLKQVSDILNRSLGAERVFILLADEPSGALRPAVASLKQKDEKPALPLSQTIIEKVINERSSLLYLDAAADMDLQRAKSVVGLHLRSVMCTPLIYRERFYGLIYLDNHTLPGEFTQSDLWLLTAIANHVAMMIESCDYATRLQGEVRRLQAQIGEPKPVFVGTSRTVSAILAKARKAADSAATILILGESGTGKEVLARCIHGWSARRAAPFVVVNCAALSDELLQSDLFGHERGAFTGAVRQKRGRLELADGGTLLLDEIGEMAPELQAKLLRFLETREFERVGGTHSIHVDVRVIAVTHRNLAANVTSGRFREDLYYRLRVIEVFMPPLRERRSDVPLLAEKFLEDYAAEMKRGAVRFSDDALALLCAHDWPGNVRELRNAVERAVVLSSGTLITEDDLQLGHDAERRCVASEQLGYHDQIRALKRRIIRDALEANDGIKNLAAERLGLRPSYLSRLMKNLEMR